MVRQIWIKWWDPLKILEYLARTSARLVINYTKGEERLGKNRLDIFFNFNIQVSIHTLIIHTRNVSINLYKFNT